MKTPTIIFSLAEKLAFVKAIDALILADGIVHDGEVNILTELMYRLDFETNFIVQARNIATKQCAIILQAMPNEKKDVLSKILKEIAVSDGFIHEKESDLIDAILSRIGLLEVQH